MQLIKFKGGDYGVPVYIRPEMVCSVQENADGDVKLIDINTVDGKTHSVQGEVDAIANMLNQQAS